MKKISLTILMVICSFTFLFVGCEHRPAPIHFEDVRSFSYEEDLAMYQEDTLRVKRNGFVNMSELRNTIEWDTDAIEQAAKECSIEWHNVTYYYDLTSKVWKIEFWAIRNTEGYPSYIYQTVYLNDKGITLLIIYDDNLTCSTFGHLGNAPDLKISNEQAEAIKSVWNNASWENDVTKTKYDYVFRYGYREVRYSYEEGIFNDIISNKHIVLSNELKTQVNSIIDKFVVVPTITID